MLKTQIIILFLIIQIGAYCQTRTIHGKILDYKTNKPIERVKITISQSDTIIYTDTRGKFEFNKPQAFDISLYLSHSGYHSNVTTVSSKSMSLNKRIKLFPLSDVNDTLAMCDDSQHKIVKGMIVEQNSGFPVQNATVIINDELKLYSNEEGDFSGLIPTSTPSFTVIHTDFESKTLSAKKARDRHNRIFFELKRVKFNHKDTIWLTHKNLIGIAVNEIANGSIGIRYQRFFKTNHAIGVHNSIYFNGKGYNYWVSDTEYKGIKIAPYYRLYTNRKNRNGGYIEGKLIAGYFDYDKLWYGPKSDNRRGTNYSEQFWTYGLGFGVGYYNFFPRSNNIIFNIYGGFQYFPMQVPNEKWNQNYGDLYVSRGGWYFFGPGSYIDIKLIISGVF